MKDELESTIIQKIKDEINIWDKYFEQIRQETQQDVSSNWDVNCSLFCRDLE